MEKATNTGLSLREQIAQRLPWANWSFWPWLRYSLTWKGWRAPMHDNPPLILGERGWQLHRCADGHPCRSSLGGGCARGHCAHLLVAPDDAGVPRFPRKRIFPPKVKGDVDA